MGTAKKFKERCYYKYHKYAILITHADCECGEYCLTTGFVLHIATNVIIYQNPKREHNLLIDLELMCFLYN